MPFSRGGKLNLSVFYIKKIVPLYDAFLILTIGILRATPFSTGPSSTLVLPLWSRGHVVCSKRNQTQGHTHVSCVFQPFALSPQTLGFFFAYYFFQVFKHHLLLAYLSFLIFDD